MVGKATNKTGTNKKESKVEIETPAEELLESPEQKALNADEAEELEEAQEAAAGAGDSSGGNAAALAAANSGTDSASFKNFRHHPDMENFYRFIFENDLRHEALAIIDQISQEKLLRRQVKTNKAQAN